MEIPCGMILDLYGSRHCREGDLCDACNLMMLNIEYRELEKAADELADAALAKLLTPDIHRDAEMMRLVRAHTKYVEFRNRRMK